MQLNAYLKNIKVNLKDLIFIFSIIVIQQPASLQ